MTKQNWEEQSILTALVTFCMLGLYTLRTHFFFLLHKRNTDETRTSKQSTNNYCSWSPSYRRFESLRKKEDLQIASDIWSERIKKLDEDEHRIKNRCKLFLSRASNVLTQWLTWCGRTLTFLGMWCITRLALLYTARKRFILVCVNLLHSWQA